MLPCLAGSDKKQSSAFGYRLQALGMWFNRFMQVCGNRSQQALIVQHVVQTAESITLLAHLLRKLLLMMLQL